MNGRENSDLVQGPIRALDRVERGKTAWARAANDQSDEPTLFMGRLWCRQRLWALIGIRFVPPYVGDHLDKPAWLALDAMALDLFRSQWNGSDDVNMALVRRASEAVGPGWPRLSVTTPFRPRSRDYAALDVPAMWGVQWAYHLVVQKSLTLTPRRLEKSGLNTAREAATVLLRSLERLSVAPYSAEVGAPVVAPTARQLELQWTEFEAAFGDALGPIFLMPYLSRSGGDPFPISQPALRPIDAEHD